LKKYNIKYIISHSTEETLEIAEKENPDIILAEFKIPDSGTRYLVRKVNENSFISHIPLVIFLSAGSKESNVDLNDFGVVIKKPVFYDDFMLKISSLIAQEKLIIPDGMSNPLTHSDGTAPENMVSSELLLLLNGDLLRELNDIKKNFVINEIDEFADRILKIAEENSISLLADFSLRMKEVLKTYNRKKINSILEEYTVLIGSLKAKNE